MKLLQSISLERFPDWNYWVKEHDDYDSLTHIAKLLSKSCIYLQSTIVTIFQQHALNEYHIG